MKGIAALFREELSAPTLFVSGLVLFPAFLFQPSLAVRSFLAMLFLLLASAAGKRMNPVPTLVVIAGIVTFNLLVPFGEVLFMIASFPVTKGALLGGIEKAVTVEGLIFLSRLIVRADFRFPGEIGDLVAKSFGYFAQITAEKSTIDRKDLFGSLDRLLLRLYTTGPSDAVSGVQAKSSKRGKAALAVLMMVCVLPYGLILFSPMPPWMGLKR